MFFQSLLLAYRLEKRAGLTMHSPSRRADWLNPDASGLSQSALGFSPGPVGRPKIRWFCASRVGGYIYNYLNIYYCKLLDWLIYSLEEQWGQPSLSNFMLSLLFSSNVTFRRTYNILNKNIYMSSTDLSIFFIFDMPRGGIHVNFYIRILDFYGHWTNRTIF